MLPVTKPVDCLAIARTFFADEAAADLVRQLLRHLEQYQAGFQALPPPARRRAAYARTAKTAAKLLQQLNAYDATELADLFRRSASRAPDEAAAPVLADTALQSRAVAGPLRIHGLEDAITVLDLLRHLGVSAGQQAGSQPETAAGRPDRPDPLVAGVEGLAAIWRQRAGRPMNRSTKAGGFGALCQLVLAAPPLAFPPTSIRHAVDRFLQDMPPAKPR